MVERLPREYYMTQTLWDYLLDAAAKGVNSPKVAIALIKYLAIHFRISKNTTVASTLLQKGGAANIAKAYKDLLSKRIIIEEGNDYIMPHVKIYEQGKLMSPFEISELVSSEPSRDLSELGSFLQPLVSKGRRSRKWKCKRDLIKQSFSIVISSISLSITPAMMRRG
jgi:hypothetical protein